MWPSQNGPFASPCDTGLGPGTEAGHWNGVPQSAPGAHGMAWSPWGSEWAQNMQSDWSFASFNDGWAPSMVSNMVNMQQFHSMDQPEEEKRYRGTVKCYYGEKHTGHGFIACPEIYNRTGQDVYLHARQAHRCEVGDEVSFSVVFNSRKEPQARSVVKKADEGKFLSKKREEAERQQAALRQKRSRIVEAPTQAANVMTEEQAKKFQKSLKGR